MSLLIDLLFGTLRIVMKYPMLTALIVFSVGSCWWSYQKGGESTRAAYAQKERRAKAKDTKQNRVIVAASEADEKTHQITIEKIQIKLEQDIEKISKIKTNQCLDSKLIDSGLCIGSGGLLECTKSPSISKKGS